MGVGRRLALAASLAAVLGCGIGPVSAPALVPAAAPQIRTDASLLEPLATPAAAPATALDADQVVFQKLALTEPVAATKPTLASGAISMKHVWQSMNNCGPASVVMLLSSLGIQTDQETARLALRGPNWARGMGPGPVDAWVSDEFGVRATWRNNGTNALMKGLISNGFAPMVTQWLEDPWVSRISHWRVVQGYDDARGVFNVYDPLRGRISLSYEWFDRNWQPFAYRYLVIHRPEDEPVLKAILGDDWSERSVRERLYQRARAEAYERSDSASWLAYGEAAYGLGLYREAVAAFETGVSLGSPQGVFTLRNSYSSALRALGRHEEAERVQQRIPTGSSGPAIVPADVIAREQALETLRSLRWLTD